MVIEAMWVYETAYGECIQWGENHRPQPLETLGSKGKTEEEEDKRWGLKMSDPTPKNKIGKGTHRKENWEGKINEKEWIVERPILILVCTL